MGKGYGWAFTAMCIQGTRRPYPRAALNEDKIAFQLVYMSRAQLAT